MNVAYFTNQYPAVSHTFIRREIQALERLGVTITRYAIRPAPGKIYHAEDAEELGKTKHLARVSYSQISTALATAIGRRPSAVLKICYLGLKMGWQSDRGLLRHFAYIVEALILAQWCRADGVQHLHAHFGTNSAAIAMLASIFSGIPYSFTAHGSEEFEKAPLLSLDVKLEYAAFAVCVSSYGRAQLMRWSNPKDWHKIFCVHCGLDGNYVQAIIEPIPSTLRFVCVGRLGEHKAQLLLIAAVRKLLDQGTRCTVVLAGDGPMKPALESAIREGGLQSSVVITGWISNEEVREQISAARALILPSFSENMPVVIMEAMALGRPVISTYIAGIPELVETGISGWLVPSSDVDALADAISTAAAASPDQLSKMGSAGRARILEQFDSLKEAHKLRGLFQRSVH